ncbi:interferon-related developmental regulator 2-like [Oscarella lobularis]|uniref:interferon-related developmental regulator 2-like n=1 Tax=Oscarella lobularis TaxID=121494 RepID=UPI0033143B07
MPPKRKKGSRISAEKSSHANGDEDEVASVSSSISETLCDVAEDELDSKPSDGVEIDDGDELETALVEHVENLSNKNARIRESALLALKKILAKKCLSESLQTRKETFVDALEKCLKKGRHGDVVLSAIVSALLCIQLGSGPEVESLFSTIKSLLVAMVQDGALQSQMRASCANALGLITFISVDDMRVVSEVMELMEKVLATKTQPEILVEAISTWCLLLSIVPSYKDKIKRLFPMMVKLLMSADVALRIVAGECLAMLYERIRESDEDEEEEFVSETVEEDMMETLQQLATDGSKHRSKKDRKQQRSSFRDVLRTIEEGESIYESHKFGLETLEIDSWARRRQFFALKDVLGFGINAHLKENDIMREIFQLGPPVLSASSGVSRQDRRQQRHHNAMLAKARRIDRQKHRDKRCS